MNVITISREMGSGGTALGRLLARRSGFGLIDKEFLLHAAQKAHVSEKAFIGYDQEMFNRTKVALESVFANNPTFYSSLPLFRLRNSKRSSFEPICGFNREKYLAITQYLFRDLARRGKVILMGRGGQLVLSGHKNALHVRVIAPLEIREKRVSRCHGISEDEARKLIRRRDRACSRYLEHFYHKNWSDPGLYDIIINTGRLSLSSAAAMILSQIE